MYMLLLVGMDASVRGSGPKEGDNTQYIQHFLPSFLPIRNEVQFLEAFLSVFSSFYE